MKLPPYSTIFNEIFITVLSWNIDFSKEIIHKRIDEETWHETSVWITTMIGFLSARRGFAFHKFRKCLNSLENTTFHPKPFITNLTSYIVDDKMKDIDTSLI
jgi:hypothetical protein